MELNERKLKYFYMHKWEIIKNKVKIFFNDNGLEKPDVSRKKRDDGALT
jgi:hypothetical protein